MSELIELVRGTNIVGRDLQARTVALPEELRAVASTDDRAWGDQVAGDHSTSLSEVMTTWTAAVAKPGQVHRSILKRQIGCRWHEVSLAILNLVHLPEFGFVLVSTRRLDEIDPPDDPSNENSAVFTAPFWCVQHLDAVGRVLRSEGDVEQLFGEPADAIEGRIAANLLHPEDRDAAVAMWVEVLASPDNTRTIQQRAFHPDGSTVWIQSVLLNRLESAGSVQCVSHDITAQRMQQLALVASEEELRFLTNAVPVAVFRLAHDGTVTFANDRWGQLLGNATTFDAVLEMIADDDRPLLARASAEAQQGRTDTTTTVRMSGDRRHLEFRLQGVRGLTRTDRGIGVIGTVDDVTSEVLRTFQLEANAELDPLTGLANRRGLTRNLTAALEADGETLVIFGDLDGFKRVNDDWGHSAGDHVLIAIGQRLSEAVRPGDLVGRWGGDEFVVVCHDIPLGDEDELVARLHDALSTEIAVEGHHYRARVSLGVVRPEAGERGEDVLRRADTAMYRAKRERHQR